MSKETKEVKGSPERGTELCQLYYLSLTFPQGEMQSNVYTSRGPSHKPKHDSDKFPSRGPTSFLGFMTGSRRGVTEMSGHSSPKPATPDKPSGEGGKFLFLSATTDGAPESSLVYYTVASAPGHAPAELPSDREYLMGGSSILFRV